MIKKCTFIFKTNQELHLWILRIYEFKKKKKCLKNAVLSESMAAIMGLLHLRFILNPKQSGFKTSTQMMVYFRFETKNMFSEFDF